MTSDSPCHTSSRVASLAGEQGDASFSSFTDSPSQKKKRRTSSLVEQLTAQCQASESFVRARCSSCCSIRRSSFPQRLFFHLPLRSRPQQGQDSPSVPSVGKSKPFSLMNLDVSPVRNARRRRRSSPQCDAPRQASRASTHAPSPRQRAARPARRARPAESTWQTGALSRKGTTISTNDILTQVRRLRLYTSVLSSMRLPVDLSFGWCRSNRPIWQLCVPQQ